MQCNAGQTMFSIQLHVSHTETSLTSKTTVTKPCHHTPQKYAQ